MSACFDTLQPLWLSLVMRMQAKESGLEQLCEFIEDCEFPELSIRVRVCVIQLSSNNWCPRTDSAPGGRARPQDQHARQVHSLHLQPRHPRNKQRPRRRGQSPRCLAVCLLNRNRLQVSSLAKFGSAVPALTDNVVVLLVCLPLSCFVR